VDVVTPGTCAGIETISRTWTAVDGCLNTASCTQTIQVVDTVPPSIVCPADITVDATSAAGAVVNFAATASDTCDPLPAVTYSQDPGTTFVIGTTIVTSTATDCSGNADSCTFTIKVRGPRAIEMDVLAQLPALQAMLSSMDERRQLYIAVRMLTLADNPAWWIDDAHLQPQYGVHVFDMKHQGVQMLEQLVAKNPALAPTLQPWIDREVLAARILVEVVLSTASGNNLALALKKLAQGDASTDAHGAIVQYKSAWIVVVF
jgi:hypothetical protein